MTCWESAIRTFIQNNEIDAYKYVFPLHLQKQSAAIIGLIQVRTSSRIRLQMRLQPIGSISPVSEMQARWVARIFAGRCQLPSRAKQQQEIDKRRADMRARYIDRPRHTIQVCILSC